MIGFNASNISLANGTLRFQIGDVSFGPSSKIELSLTSGVPEPATWAMMVIGFGAIGAVMRGRQRVTLAYV